MSSIDRTANPRNSSIEFLRIISMIMVLILHANFFSLGVPVKFDIISSPIHSIASIFIESLCLVAVNVFVLISGWFGIRLSVKRIVGFVFQVWFFLLVGAIIYMIINHSFKLPGGGKELILSLLSPNYWFVKAYLILMLLAPIINCFLQYSTKQTILFVIIALFVFQSVWGFIFNTDWYSGGSSPISFVFLYLLAQYFRKYHSSSVKSGLCLIVYFCCSMALTLIIICSTLLQRFSSINFLAYSNPLIILASFCLFLPFTKHDYHNTIINYIATSAFAVYLFHCHYLLMQSYYVSHIQYLHDSLSTSVFLVRCALFLLLVFIASLFIDKLRIAAWNFLCRFYYRLRCLFEGDNKEQSKQ